MSTITKRLTVDQYDQMVENGILPETNRFELINGRIVEKDVKNPAHPTATDLTRRAIERLLPAGWYVRKEDPVRIPNRRSEPEPDVSVVRGDIRDYETRHPNPEEVALVVEVTRSSVAKDRASPRLWRRRHSGLLDRQHSEAPPRSLRRARPPAGAGGAIPGSQDPERVGHCVSQDRRSGSWQDRRGGPASVGNAIGMGQLGNLV